LDSANTDTWRVFDHGVLRAHAELFRLRVNLACVSAYEYVPGLLLGRLQAHGRDDECSSWFERDALHDPEPQVWCGGYLHGGHFVGGIGVEIGGWILSIAYAAALPALDHTM
jgi:hypothetical protein